MNFSNIIPLLSVMCSRVQVRVQSGILEGCINKNTENSGTEYFSFQRIPYAKPPIGELRFKAPEEGEPWEGIKDATKDGDQCFSRHFVHRDEKRGSENCLTLNVYTPKLPVETEDKTEYALKPVMVYIHGGAFTHGSNSKSIQNPEFLLREDVVIVAINYRLGLLGFMSLDDPSLEVPGNAGFKDMVMALKWVKRNIKYFMGDPYNITIFGESAGASSVHLLTISPAAQGLFHKAILQSGCALSIRAQSNKHGPMLSKLLGITGNNEREVLQTLKNITVEEIHEIQEKLLDTWHGSEIRSFGFVKENSDQKGEPFLIEEPLALIRKGKYNQVPFLMGYNSREGMIVHARSKVAIQDIIPDFELNVPFHLGLKRGTSTSKEVAHKIKEFYFGDQEVNVADIDKYYQLISDNFFIRDLYRSAKLCAKTSSKPLYLYEMTLETPINMFKAMTGIKLPGVCHGDDLSYLFKTPFTGVIKPNSTEDVGIRRFCRIWANFARYGNPNSPCEDKLLPVAWQPFTVEKKDYFGIGSNLSSKNNPVDQRMKFWERIYEDYTSSDNSF